VADSRGLCDPPGRGSIGAPSFVEKNAEAAPVIARGTPVAQVLSRGYFFCTTAIPVGAFPPDANGEPARPVRTPVCELNVNTEMSLDALQT
jgi:hypothetical protein